MCLLSCDVYVKHQFSGDVDRGRVCFFLFFFFFSFFFLEPRLPSPLEPPRQPPAPLQGKGGREGGEGGEGAPLTTPPKSVVLPCAGILVQLEALNDAEP